MVNCHFISFAFTAMPFHTYHTVLTIPNVPCNYNTLYYSYHSTLTVTSAPFHPYHPIHTTPSYDMISTLRPSHPMSPSSCKPDLLSIFPPYHANHILLSVLRHTFFYPVFYILTMPSVPRRLCHADHVPLFLSIHSYNDISILGYPSHRSWKFGHFTRHGRLNYLVNIASGD